MTALRLLRYVAFAEATSFLALLVAAYFKHDGQGETGVSILGPIHGALFLAYVVLTFVVREHARWSNGTTLAVLIGAVLPFGGYVVDWKILRTPPQQPA